MITLTESIQKYLIANSTYEARKGRKFYVSDMGKCQRVRWVKRHDNIAQRFDPHVYWILHIGNMYEEYAYKALEAQGRLIEAQGKVETEHFKGKYDAKVFDRNNKKAIVDFKSAGGYKFKKIIDGQDDEWNVAQVLTYLMLERDKGATDLESAILLYINKEPSERGVKEVFYQKQFFLNSIREKRLREEMDTLVNYWEKGEVPPCTCPAWMKPYNSFQSFCQMEETRVLKTLQNYAQKGIKLLTDSEKLVVIKDKKETVLWKVT